MKHESKSRVYIRVHLFIKLPEALALEHDALVQRRALNRRQNVGNKRENRL